MIAYNIVFVSHLASTVQCNTLGLLQLLALTLFYFCAFIACLHEQNKSFFWRTGFYPANHSNLKSIQKA